MSPENDWSVRNVDTYCAISDESPNEIFNWEKIMSKKQNHLIQHNYLPCDYVKISLWCKDIFVNWNIHEVYLIQLTNSFKSTKIHETILAQLYNVFKKIKWIQNNMLT